MGVFAIAKGFVTNRVAYCPVVFVGVGFIEVVLRVFELGFAVGGGPAFGEGTGDRRHNVVAGQLAQEYRRSG